MNFDFEKSVEFDLFACDYGKSLMENYQMLDLLYESDRSAVYKLLRFSDQKHYTLKALKKEEGIVYDLARIAHLSHEGMSRIIEFGESDNYRYVVKPYVEGVTLLEFVASKGPLDEGSVKNIAGQIIDVFEYFHSQSDPIVYRDLKPANIILKSDGKIVLIDIETMRLVAPDRGSDTFYVGTHGYASPEQYGFRQSDTRSDIYSLGATLYFLLTGSEPVIESVAHRGLHEMNPNVSGQMAYVITKCMRFNPEDRFDSVTGIKQALFSKLGYRKPMDRKIKIGLITVAIIAVLFISGNLLVQAITANIIQSLSEVKETVAYETTPPETTPPETGLPEVIPTTEVEAGQPLETEPATESVKETHPPAPDPTFTTVAPAEPETLPVETEPVAVTVEETLPPVTVPPSTEPPPTEPPPTGREWTPRGYASRDEVVLAEIPVLSTGISITPDPADPHYLIKVDRDKVSVDFKYITVYSAHYAMRDREIEQMIYDGVAKGSGLQTYDDLRGFGSTLDGDDYLVVLYDDNFICVGYQYFKGAEFKGASPQESSEGVTSGYASEEEV